MRPNNLAWIAHRNYVIRNILCDDRTGADNAVRTDRYSRKDKRAGTNECAFANRDFRGNERHTFLLEVVARCA